MRDFDAGIHNVRASPLPSRAVISVAWRRVRVQALGNAVEVPRRAALDNLGLGGELGVLLDEVDLRLQKPVSVLQPDICSRYVDRTYTSILAGPDNVGIDCKLGVLLNELDLRRSNTSALIRRSEHQIRQ